MSFNLMYYYHFVELDFWVFIIIVKSGDDRENTSNYHLINCNITVASSNKYFYKQDSVPIRGKVSLHN